jgi:spore coat polysaccharide biosynthesis protein SpsF
MMDTMSEQASYSTDQENFWAGNFGDDYIARNTLDHVPSRLAMFSRILSRTSGVGSVIEFGANIGINLCALHHLLPQAEIKAVEINPNAAKTLQSYPWISSVSNSSFIAQSFADEADLSFTSGVLIHINPEFLPKAYENLYNASRRYVMVAEYYSPAPVSIPYRGHSERLYKRDFAGEMLDMFPDLRLVDYGFVYRRDPVYPADDLTWFLMEKRR